MHLTILTADLLPPVNFAPRATLPAFDTLCARSEEIVSPSSTLEETLLDQFGLNTKLNHLSPAQLTAMVDIKNTALAAETVWLRADPVHLAVSRDNVQLFDSHVVKPTADEMALIAATINQHFAQDGLSFLFPDPARGYVAIASNAMPETTPLWRMMGANVFDHMPSGANGSLWRTRMNEIQMLLHDHPVNMAREARGERAINGLWCWGGGHLPAAPTDQKFTPVFTAAIGRLAMLRGIAAWSDLPITPLPEKFQDVNLDDGHTLIVLHSATRELRAMSPETWQREAIDIDRYWLAPALAAFDAKKITSLGIIVANDIITQTIHVRPKTILSRLSQVWRQLTTKNHHA
jgi:hypothetical protein